MSFLTLKLLLAIIFFLLISSSPLHAAPIPGQIIIDPQHSNRMIYNAVTINNHPKPVLLCGPGDPEDFFYHDTQTSLNTMKTNHAKTTYIMAYVKDNCSGCNPGTGAALDAKLNEWAGYLDQMEDAGITPVFFFFDDSYSMPSGWLTGDGPKIVNKIKNRANGTPRKLLIWSIAEEYSEGLTDQQAKDVAAMIRANDPNGHIIGVHQLPGPVFKFNSDPNLQMFLMQLNGDDIIQMNTTVNTAWVNVNGNKILNMAENIDHAYDSRTIVRQRNWAAILGGASIVQVHKMGGTGPDFNNDPTKYTDCNNLTSFMETTRVNFMAPNNSLKSGTAEFVLAEPNFSYILYTRNGGSPGLIGITAGTYNLTWLDAVSGTKFIEAKTLPSGTQTFSKPAAIGTELALYLIKSSGPPPSITPTAVPPSASFKLLLSKWLTSAFDQNQDSKFNSLDFLEIFN